MRQLLHTALAALARLSPREQRLVAVFALLLVLVGVYTVVVEPLVAGRARLAQRIDGLSHELVAMEDLAARIRSLEPAAGESPAPTATGDGFSLFAFIDKATAASVSRDAIAAMNPSRRPTRDGFEESAVELRLTSVTLPELVALLRQIEQAEQPVYVKRLEVKRRYDDKTRFDATILTGALART